MKRILWFAILFVLGVVLLVGCGDGNGENKAMTAAEVSASYEQARPMLQSYFNEIATRGGSGNPDITATSDELGTKLIVKYKGIEIYNETHEWGIYMSHGSTLSGDYLILIHQHDPGQYYGITHLYVNGKEAFLSLDYPIEDIREFDSQWIIIKCTDGSSKTARIDWDWALYNLQTGELKKLGKYGFIKRMIDPIPQSL